MYYFTRETARKRVLAHKQIPPSSDRMSHSSNEGCFIYSPDENGSVTFGNLEPRRCDLTDNGKHKARFLAGQLIEELGFLLDEDGDNL